MPENIEANIKMVKEKIRVAAEKSGRTSEAITLVAVTKRFSAAIIREAVKDGLTDIGESRLQEAAPKIKELGHIARWHMIGHLQTNKVRKAIPLFDLIQSLDSYKLADEINRQAETLERKVNCLLEVNSSGEDSKYGFRPDETPGAIKKLTDLEHINLCGLMTIGPYTDDTDAIRRAFVLTRELFTEGQKIVGDNFSTLSMGMSSDYELAIEEGSTMVRVGTAIFGIRPI
ncbi:MAG: YggS family pyridoxal phosphate-dependent enzyme [Candidatus Zixiibacteriota bacterium]|nr:MAG: YggS family pyridoxal phosphate-dependent enzyme [candidate division Zixibacteria bacterium]